MFYYVLGVAMLIIAVCSCDWVPVIASGLFFIASEIHYRE